MPGVLLRLAGSEPCTVAKTKVGLLGFVRAEASKLKSSARSSSRTTLLFLFRIVFLHSDCIVLLCEPDSVRSGVLFCVIDYKHLNGGLAYFQLEAQFLYRLEENRIGCV